MLPEEIDGCVGRYGRVPQHPHIERAAEYGPFWYGQVIELHSSRKAVKFKISNITTRWYSVKHVQLHPLKDWER